MLSPVDERRADRVDMIQKQAAEKLMNRLHLMRKVVSDDDGSQNTKWRLGTPYPVT
jgi:hypothetical protein